MKWFLPFRGGNGKMFSMSFRKSLPALLSAAMLFAQLSVPVMAAETKGNEAVKESATESTINVQSTNLEKKGITISLNSPLQIKTGSEIKPDYEVYVSGNKVFSSKDGKITGVQSANFSYGDFKVEYANNKKAGVAAMIVSPSSNKAKKIAVQTPATALFTISSKKIKASKFQVLGVKGLDYSQSGNDYYLKQQKDIAVYYTIPETLEKIKLTEGVDYELTSIKGTARDGKNKSVRLVITGKGNFKGTKKVSFKVWGKKQAFSSEDNIKVSVSYDKLTLREFDKVDYTGSKIKPEVTVKTAKGEKLSEGSDYKVSYKKNKTPGLATIVITPKKGLKSTYGGTIKFYFQIAGKPMTYKPTTGVNSSNAGTNTDIKDQYDDYTWTGSTITPKLKVYEGGDKLDAKDYVVVLRNAVDKKKKTASDLNDRPTAYVFGKGKYSGYKGMIYYSIVVSGENTES